MKKIISWIDANVLAILAGLLLVFIPLYPKWPLFDVLPGYIVRVRLEDFVIAFTALVFLIQLARKKVAFTLSPVTIGLGLYIIFGFLSFLSAVFITKTVPLEFLHAGKTLLHWGRRIEYFSLFFVVFGAIKSMRTVRVFTFLLFLTLFLVTIYGFGQKYLYWPAFSTMNREFSKGWWLYLTEHARVLSTFGGHYDLAGYLVILLSLCWSFWFALKKSWQKFAVGVILAGGFWLLILTASRISFGAYMISLAMVVFLWAYKKGVSWGISRGLLAIFLSMFIMLSFGDLSDRFLKLFRISERLGNIRELVLSPAAKRPENQALFLENNLAAVTSKTDIPPTPIKPFDVNKNAAPLLIATTSATGEITYVERPRVYSQNAVMFDLSTGIRLDATWPKAIAAFKKNPLLGTGYATLTKTNVEEFTEAESTDNDYLRSLGETGLLGALTLFGTLILMGFFAYRSLGGIKDPFLYGLATGFIAYLVGLAFNATYIDIFEASKVAYAFWGTSGLVLGALYLNRQKIKEDYQPLKMAWPFKEWLSKLKDFLQKDTLWVILLMTLTLTLRSYKLDTPLADWHSWRQADTSAVTRDFVRHGINFLYPTFDDLSSIASGKPNLAGLRYVEFPVYNAMATWTKRLLPEFNYEAAGRFTTAAISTITALFVFLIARTLLTRRVAYLSAGVFALLPYSIFYGRTILPDPTMVMFGFGSLFFGIRFAQSNKVRFLFLFSLFLSLAVLVKPFSLVFLVPLIYVFYVERKTDPRSWIFLLVGIFAAVIPFVAWRLWISQFPEGIPASDWLFNGNGIRFKGAFWFWLFADRIGRLILGYWGVALLVIGLIRRLDGKYKFFPLALFAGSILYLFIIATGNVQHDYYQILLLPAISICVGVGLDHLMFARDRFINLWTSKLVAVILVLFMLGFGWYHVRDYYNINHPEIVEAGKKVLDITSGRNEKALVIAPYDGDTAFLYQTERKGWPIMEGSIEDMIKKGANYYVSVRFDKTTTDILADAWPKGKLLPKGVIKKYTILEQNNRYVVIQLVPDNLLIR